MEIKLIRPLKVEKDDKTKTYWLEGMLKVKGLDVKISGGTSAVNEDARLYYEIADTFNNSQIEGIKDKFELMEDERIQREVTRKIWKEIKRQEDKREI